MTALGNAPAHWARTTIGEIAEVRLGRQRSPKNHAGDAMRPYLRAANVGWYRLRPDDVQEMNFTEDEMATYALRENDTLVVEGSGSASEVGKCALVPKAFAGHAFQNTLIRVRPHEGVDPRWLMYRINAEAELGGFLALARGVGIFHLGSTRTGKWPVAIPPLSEQRAIVEAIERLLSHLDAALDDIARSERRMRVAGRSLIETILTAAPDAPLVALGDLAVEFRNGGHWREPSPTPPGHPILRISAVRPGQFRSEERSYVTTPVSEDDLSRFTIRDGSLLFTRYNGNPSLVGACARVPASAAGVLHPDKLIRVDLDDRCLPDWVELAVSGGVTRRHIDQHVKTTSGQAGIAGRDLKRAPVPVPSRAVQKKLIDEGRRYRGRLERLAQLTDRTSVRADVLRRSILKAAFEGRLTQEPTAASSADDLEEVLA